jgi:hypothetical protein
MARLISIYTRRLGRDVARRAKGTVGRYNVIPAQFDKWIVVAEGKLKTIKAFQTRWATVTFAKKYASVVNAGEVIIPDTDGSISARITY